MSATSELTARADALSRELAERGVEGCELAMVLGSGLGSFVEGLEDRLEISGDDLEHLPKSAVPGHAGKIVVGTISGVRVLVQMGRVHLYEGWSAYEVTRAVRAFAGLGVRGLVLTNAAGSTVREWPPGTLMLMRDHLNLQQRAPLFPEERAVGCPYDPGLCGAIEEGAQEAGVTLRSGVYAAVLGPTYETPKQVEMVRWMGGDAVGMSTVCEAAAGAAAGMRVAAVSCLTNHAAGITTERLRHEDVVAVGLEVAEDMVRLFRSAVPRLERALRD